MTEDAEPPPRRPVADVLAAEAGALLAIEGVVGVAEGQVNGEPAVLVMAGGLSASSRRRIPRHLAGYAVVVQDTGAILAPPREPG